MQSIGGVSLDAGVVRLPCLCRPTFGASISNPISKLDLISTFPYVISVPSSTHPKKLLFLSTQYFILVSRGKDMNSREQARVWEMSSSEIPWLMT